MRQPYGGATRGIGRLEVGPNDPAFRHFAQRPLIQNRAAGTDDDGHGKIVVTHETNMPSTHRKCMRDVMQMGSNFCGQVRDKG